MPSLTISAAPRPLLDRSIAAGDFGAGLGTGPKLRLGREDMHLNLRFSLDPVPFGLYVGMQVRCGVLCAACVLMFVHSSGWFAWLVSSQFWVCGVAG